MNFTTYDIALVPIIVALTAVFRRTGVPKRYLPLVSLTLGIIGAFVYLSPENPKQAILIGIVMGLTAVGAHSGIKNSFEKKI